MDEMRAHWHFDPLSRLLFAESARNRKKARAAGETKDDRRCVIVTTVAATAIKYVRNV